MTDKELLVLAAKAAGIELLWPICTRGDEVPWSLTHARHWNPRAYDGDALRLAAKLIIDIEWATEYIVFANGNYSDDIKNHGNDHAATVRSVIVRAAAEIGKAMP